MAGAPSQQYGTRMASAHELFQIGWGTDRIADYWNITEAEAERRLSIERSIHKGLPNPYEARP
jgi:hypothetical protein